MGGVWVGVNRINFRRDFERAEEMLNVKTSVVGLAAAGVVLAAGGSVAEAGYTHVASGGQGGSEPSVANVLSALIGGATISEADVNGGGVELGGVTGLSRVSDTGDQLFQDGPVPVSVMGLFFGNANINNPFGGAQHELYYENESLGGSAVQLTNGSSVLGNIGVGMGEKFSLTAVRGGKAFDGSQDNTDRAIASSIVSENVASGSTSADRMVTFEIDIEEIPTLNGLDGSLIDLQSLALSSGATTAHIHFFDTGSDADYQDAVYLTVGARASAIPTPAAAPVAAVGLGVVCGRRRRR